MNSLSISFLRSSVENNLSIVVTVVLGSAYLFYMYGARPMLLSLMKLGMNPIDPYLGQVIPEHETLSYDQLHALGVLKGKSVLIVGGTRGIGYGTALAVAKAGASVVTIVGRNDKNGLLAVAKIRSEIGIEDDDPKSIPNITYRKGDVGTAASTKKLVKALQDDSVRYDYLIVTAAVLTAPKFRNPSPLNEDGIEKCFAIGVVGRFLLYRNATTFMNQSKNTDDDKSASLRSPMILNVCAAGDGKGGFDRTLVRKLAEPTHFLNDANYAVGNELMLRKLLSVEQANAADGSRFRIPIVSTHPGFIETDLLNDQGFLVDTLVPFLCHFIGTGELESGRREVSKLCAIASGTNQKQNADVRKSKLAMVDNFGRSSEPPCRLLRAQRCWRLFLTIADNFS